MSRQYRLTVPYIGKAERLWVAKQMAEHIRDQGQIHGKNALDIHNALVKLNVYLAELMNKDSPDAFMSAEPDEDMMAVLYVGMKSTDPKYKRGIMHELAQALQVTWVAENLYDCDHVICTQQDNELARHKIAEYTEQEFWDIPQ